MLFVVPINDEVRVSVLNRVAAKLIDLFLVILVSAVIPYPVGPLLGFIYSICGDGMNFGHKLGGSFQGGQSVGKKLLKLRAIQVQSRQPVNYRDSAIRNAPVGVATFFAIIPVWGWLILALIGIPLMVMEVYLMATVETGHRLGDVMSDTEVVEIKS